MALEETPAHPASPSSSTNNRVVLFMKGTRSFPQCGFSATVVQILDDLVPEYQTVNVLKDPDLREGIKAVLELADHPAAVRRREVRRRLRHRARDVRVGRAAGAARRAGAQRRRRRACTLTEAARKAVLARPAAARRARCASASAAASSTSSSLDEPRKGDFEIDAGGVTLLIDPMSAKRADGITIDYASDERRRVPHRQPERARARAPARAGRAQGDARARRAVQADRRAHATQEHGDRAHRGRHAARRRGRAPARGARSRTRPLVFYCHHGMRSRAAAERFAKDGCKRVYNLEGGIDAWSREIDPKVPRY